MARRRRELPPSDVGADPLFDFRWLRTTLMASEPDTPAAAISKRLLREAGAIDRRGGSIESKLAALWEVVDELGVRRAAEHHLAYMHRIKERREREPQVRPA